MQQRYDVFAFSLLVFSVILLTAISIDPVGFSLHEWQTLLAALGALAGASMVYRGANLAYRASMAKVDIDREHHDQAIRRSAYKIMVRLRFATFLIKHDADRIKDLLRRFKRSKVKIDTSRLKFDSAELIEEAWANLETFDHATISEIGELKMALLKFANIVLELNSDTEKVQTASANELQEMAEQISDAATHIWQLLQRYDN
ncbi:hypothetical protein [Bradyrhizobium sp. S3.9.1]|uniref:hypothetical protein n=1 Tax=Bradyrhizobium sp. S3.9.1 TaxID=3156431 RepID=UPI0033969452